MTDLLLFGYCIHSLVVSMVTLSPAVLMALIVKTFVSPPGHIMESTYVTCGCFNHTITSYLYTSHPFNFSSFCTGLLGNISSDFFVTIVTNSKSIHNV